MAGWPIVARTAEAGLLAAALLARPARAQMLRGPSGIGKTTLAAAVAQSAVAEGRTVVPIVALEELRGVPLGALSPLLAASRFAGEDDVGERMRELMAVVGRHADAYLLIVDDAPLLDEASAAALYQLVRVFGVPALLTARDGHVLGGPVARLLHEDLVTVTELDGLTIVQVRELLRRRLGDDPRPESLQQLHELTRGNPLFLREVTLAAERDRRVRPGPFGIEILPGAVPDHVLATVADRLERLSEEQLAFAAMLAVAQPWPAAATLAEEEPVLADLQRAGVVAPVEGSGAAVLRLAHPVFAEALLARLDSRALSEQRRRAGRRLVERPEPPVRFAALGLLADAGELCAVDDLVWASGYAHAAGDHTRALALAARALEQRAEDGPALLLRASALSARGEAEAADAAFAEADARAAVVPGDLRARVQLRWGQHTALRGLDPAAAVARATAALPELDAAGRALLGPDLAKWRLMAGDAAALHEPMESAAEGEAALTAALGRAMIATMTGRMRDAEDAVAAGRPLTELSSGLMPFAGSLLDLSAFLVHVGDGRVADARAFAEERRLQPFSEAAGVWSYALALIHLHAGRLHDAESAAALAIEQLRWRDFTGLLAAATALAATVAAQLGDAGLARDRLAAIGAAQHDDAKVLLQAAEAEAWAAIVAGEDERAAALIATAVGRALELGHLLLAALTATVAVRCGGAAMVRDALAGAAQASDSPFIRSVARLAEVVVARDAAALLALGPELEARGLVATLHDCLVLAAEWPMADRMLARRIRVVASELALGQTPVRRGSSAGRGRGLTEREWSVARAAARRQRSREIAEQLGVSVRTVDNHLANVYRKLGVSGRDELEAALGERQG
ncbi:helix-turn-helix transcriptional regulator [Microcella daejeonensis]|uniref:LuxR C-terminal-related transcriptional regulator n=1 Tax=Microcella daejeonensis TaxID=2994971 RepID=UPI00226FC08D|nr:helix-turn-helix transcriptional regulator [Microcella daejeonensis]WAB84402.1 helix-turn-helix transcriptional regulator [Microcella daejeonensis]